MSTNTWRNDSTLSKKICIAKSSPIRFHQTSVERWINPKKVLKNIYNASINCLTLNTNFPVTDIFFKIQSEETHCQNYRIYHVFKICRRLQASSWMKFNPLAQPVNVGKASMHSKRKVHVPLQKIKNLLLEVYFFYKYTAYHQLI